MRRLQETAVEEELKSMSTVVNGVSRLAWSTTLAPKPAEYVTSSSQQTQTTTNQSKILKNILSALQLNRVDFSISKLDDHSKIVFPVLFSCFCCVYWLYYSFSSSGSDTVDEF